MNRDLNLAKEILKEYRDHDPFSGEPLRQQLARRWEPAKFYYHIGLLLQGGYLEENLLDKTGVRKLSEEDLHQGDGTEDVLVLTWKGHDLLERLHGSVSEEIEDMETESETFEKPSDD